jgi:hypothetical protein
VSITMLKLRSGVPTEIFMKYVMSEPTSDTWPVADFIYLLVIGEVLVEATSELAPLAIYSEIETNTTLFDPSELAVVIGVSAPVPADTERLCNV